MSGPTKEQINQALEINRILSYSHHKVFSYIDKSEYESEGLIAIARAAKSYDGRTKWSGYVWTCIKKIHWNIMRKCARHSKRFIKYPLPDNDKNDVYGKPDKFIENMDNKTAIERLLARPDLSEKEKTIIKLMLDGYNGEEIGGKLGMIRKGVWWIVEKIRKKVN